MGFRIGSLILYPQMVMIPLGAAFFLVIAYKRHSVSARSRRGLIAAVISSAVMAAAGALILADESDPHAIFGGQLSFAGYWGALIGACVWALISRNPVAAAGNAVAPAVMLGGAVARIGCLFAGCCRGASGILLYHVWPLYDIAALLVALMLGVREERRRSSGSLLSFLIVYGFLRFFLEFIREARVTELGLTTGQLFAGAQVGVGVALVLAGKAKSAVVRNQDV